MTSWYYLWLDLFTISFPLAASFDKRLSFHRTWPGLFTGILVAGALFLAWDAAFTFAGVWGFNDGYLVGPRLLDMPIEEWLFFLVVPYACLFLYEVMNYFVKRDVLGRIARPLSFVLILLLTVTGLVHLDRLYTSITFLSAAACLAYVSFALRPLWLGRFYVGYGVSLIPFFLVNGILTGWLLPEPIVWYNDAENLGIRMGTIPVEDSIYLLLLLLLVTIFHERGKR